MPLLRAPTPEEHHQLVLALSALRQRLPLDVYQIQELAGRARIRELRRGGVLMKQDDLADHLYFILSGQLRATDTSSPEPRVLNYHAVHAFVGEQGLLHNRPRAATVDAISDAKLACWNKTDFAWLAGLNERVRPYFEEIYQGQVTRLGRTFPGRQPDEAVVFQSRKHMLQLASTLLRPFLLLLSGLGLLIGLRQLYAEIALIEIIAGVPVTVALAWGLFGYFDWQNDEYIVTSKRVIHVERVLLYGEQWDEAPLVRVQDVTVVAHDWLQRAFDYSDVIIKTAGAGNIVFAGMREAQRVREIIFQEQTKATERRAADQTGTIRAVLAQRIGKPVPEAKWPIDAQPPASGQSGDHRVRQLLLLVDYLYPRLRIVKGNTITWRKHWLILVRRVALPILLFILALALTILIVRFDRQWLTLAIVPGFGMFAAIIWYLWRYDDWYRDVYMISGDRIIDVQSSSFRLKGEQRREGTFNAVQNVTYHIPGFLDKVLNMGDVIIETAGTERTFTFNKVFDPSAVQQEIFDRWDAYQEGLRRRERESQTQRFADWIGEYHEMQRGAR